MVRHMNLVQDKAVIAYDRADFEARRFRSFGTVW